MWADYIGIMAVLGFAYICLRYSIWSIPPAPRERGNYEGHALEVRQVSARLQDLRQQMREGKIPRRADFDKRALNVQRSRERIAQLPFFKTPVPPEAPAQDHNLHLMLI